MSRNSRSVIEHPRLAMIRRRPWTMKAEGSGSMIFETNRRLRTGIHRSWDPRRSKLAAGLVNAQSEVQWLPDHKSTVLYLGAGHGRTVSHLHDLMWGREGHGRLIAIDISARCLRDLRQMAATRQGILPILGDVREVHWMAMSLDEPATHLIQDVSTSGQDEIFARSTRFLQVGGWALLSLKLASERGGKTMKDAVTAAHSTLTDHGLEVLEILDLAPHQREHRLFVARKVS